MGNHAYAQSIFVCVSLLMNQYTTIDNRSIKSLREFISVPELGMRNYREYQVTFAFSAKLPNIKSELHAAMNIIQ